MYQLNESQLRVFNDRYALKDNEGKQIENNVEDMWHRIAKAISSVEVDNKYWEDKFYDILYDFKFIPGGRIINGAGSNKTTFFNCFVINKPEDSRQGIMKNLTDMVEIMSRGGGVGVNLSSLRPKNAYVAGVNGHSSGAVSWGEMYSQATGCVCQGGSRRGALLLGLEVSHPDIEEFITIKQNYGKLTNANLSVLVSDDFMDAVENDNDWNLIFDNKIYKTIKAQYLWNLICESAWRSGEPGLIFLEQYNKRSNTWYFDEIICCNPCMDKNTYLVTENGLEKISKLKSKIWNGNEYTESKSWNTGIKKVIKLMTNSGFEYTCTPDHKFLLKNNQWCEAKDTLGKDLKFYLKEKEWIGNNPYPNVNYQVLGFELGDGSFHIASDRMFHIYCGTENDKEVIELIEKEFDDKFHQKEGTSWIINIPINTVYANAFKNKIEHRIIPDWILKLPKKEMKDFIRGLFSANGTNLKDYGKIQLVSINKEMLQQVQQMLLLFGIKSKLWYHNKKQNIEFKNGIYECKQSCHLVISRKSYVKYLNEIGFIQKYKNGYTNRKYKDETQYEKVILITELDELEVWDFSEPILHQGITNGAIIHNCGEQGLPEWAVCNLGSINLSKFVENNKINYISLKETIKTAVRFLDNVIDVTPYFFDKNESVQKSSRRVGMGTLGLADALIKLKIKYGSQESIEFCDKLYEFIAIETYKASIDIAKEKGYFPKFDFDKYFIENNKTLASTLYKILPDEYKDLAKKYGIRNSCLITQAPTGSTGLLANTSSSIEPNFAFEYMRNDRLGKNIIRHELYQQWLNENLNKEKSDYFITAQELTPEEHIKMQAVIQKWVDSSISKTINAPNNHTVDEVKKAYILSYNLGNKGVTYYRDKSRDEQVLNLINEEEEEKPKKLRKLARGYITPSLQEAKGYRIRLNSGCGSLWLMVFADKNGNIVETFVNTGGKGGCTISTQALSRMISLALRGGISLDNVVDQLESAGNCPSYQFARGKGIKVSKGGSCPGAIAKALLKIQENLKNNNIDNIKNIEIVESIEIIDDNNCPDCGMKMIHANGCVSCNCGYSKCN